MILKVKIVINTHSDKATIENHQECDIKQAKLSSPFGIAIMKCGDILIAQYSYDVIRRISNGIITTIGTLNKSRSTDGHISIALFNGPYGICVDSEDNIIITEYDGCRIRKISIEGIVSTIAGSGSYGFVDGFKDNVKFDIQEELLLELMVVIMYVIVEIIVLERLQLKDLFQQLLELQQLKVIWMVIH